MRNLASLLTLLFVIAGCAVSDRVVYKDAEGAVPDKFFSSVKKKKTKKDWIVGNLGQPHTVDEVGRVEFYTYRMAKSQYRKVSVLLVLNRGVVEEDEEFYHVMLCDDIVERAWFDEYSAIETARYAKKSKCFDKQES